MNWERGQIDYLGVDSFDNILRQIDTSITQSNDVGAMPAGVQSPRPPPSDDQIEREETFVRGTARKQEMISKEQVDELGKRRVVGFRPKPKPMRGQGQHDHRERYVRVDGGRSQQPVTDSDLAAAASGPSFEPTGS